MEQYVNYKHPTAIKTVRLQPQLNLLHIPDIESTRLPSLKLPSELSNTSSKLYPPLKPLRKSSTSLSNLLDNTSEYTPSQDTTSSLFVPQHRYNLRDLPSRRNSTDTSTLNLSALSCNSALRHTINFSELFPKRHHFSHPKITFQPSTLPSSEQHPSLPIYSTTNSHPNDDLATQHDILINNSVTSNTDTPIKIYSRVNYPFPPPSS